MINKMKCNGIDLLADYVFLSKYSQRREDGRLEHWDEVAAVLFTNDYLFTGVSLLPKMGDQIYDNAPFQRLSSSEVESEYNAIKEYLDTHEVDFNEIMSDRENFYSGDMVAVGCSGGACELK